MAKITVKGQVTIPKSVRDALALEPGDRIRFEIDNGRALVEKAADLIDLAGSVPVPEDLRGASWEEVREAAHRSWAEQSEGRWRP